MPHGRLHNGDPTELIVRREVFVLRRDVTEFTTLTCYRDGSCGFRRITDDGPAGTFAGHSFEFGDDNHASARKRLEQLGFVPLAEAVVLGWVPSDWTPPGGLRDFGRI
ncbi:MAG TPA: hypothetical protein VEA69_16350 [Tepidisphaeraceae bacterium]|nr:hypothetical protein [Tepidisphaeraceae bacterium]